MSISKPVLRFNKRKKFIKKGKVRINDKQWNQYQEQTFKFYVVFLRGL